jgi:thioredoxin-dependent peroxiredoxin
MSTVNKGDLLADFELLDAQRVGISPDPVTRQAEFAAVNNIDYPLLSDPTGEIATRFGARRGFGPLLTRRRTYVIDTNQRIVDVIKSELRMSIHADRALAALRTADTHPA